MNSSHKLARRNLVYQRIQNYLKQIIPVEYKVTDVFSNHPESFEFEFHFSVHTPGENSFRLIFSGPIFGIDIYLRFNFEKQITPKRILTLQSFLKKFMEITTVDFLAFVEDVDMLVEDTKNLTETKK